MSSSAIYDQELKTVNTGIDGIIPVHTDSNNNIPYHRVPIPTSMNSSNFDIPVTADKSIMKCIKYMSPDSLNKHRVCVKGCKVLIKFFGKLLLDNSTKVEEEKEILLEDCRINYIAVTIGALTQRQKLMSFFDIILPTMKEEEISWFKIFPPYGYDAYKADGLLTLPNNTMINPRGKTLLYEVRLLKITNWTIALPTSIEDLLIFCQNIREEAKDQYQQRNFTKAVSLYQDAVKSFRKLWKPMENHSENAVELCKEKQIIELNLLVTLFQIGRYKDVISLSKEISLADGCSVNSMASIKFNSKLYRIQSKAFFELGLFEESKRAIDTAIKWNEVNIGESDEENITASMLNQEHLRKVNDALKQIDGNSKAIKSLFSSLSTGDQEQKDRNCENNGNLDQEEDDDNDLIYGSDGTCFRRLR